MKKIISKYDIKRIKKGLSIFAKDLNQDGMECVTWDNLVKNAHTDFINKLDNGYSREQAFRATFDSAAHFYDNVYYHHSSGEGYEEFIQSLTDKAYYSSSSIWDFFKKRIFFNIGICVLCILFCIFYLIPVSVLSVMVEAMIIIVLIIVCKLILERVI